MTEPAHAPSGLKVLAIGADPILRQGVAQYLRLILSSVTVGEVSSVLEVLEMVPASAWDLIVLDLAGPSDLAPLNHLKQTVPDAGLSLKNSGKSKIPVEPSRNAAKQGISVSYSEAIESA